MHSNLIPARKEFGLSAIAGAVAPSRTGARHREPSRAPRTLWALPDGGALEKGNTVTPCIFETFGGFEGSAVNLLNELSKAARAKTPPGQEPPWSARNFVPYWSQLLSREVQLGVADEIIARTREEAASIEAGNGRGA